MTSVTGNRDVAAAMRLDVDGYPTVEWYAGAMAEHGAYCTDCKLVKNDGVFSIDRCSRYKHLRERFYRHAKREMSAIAEGVESGKLVEKGAAQTPEGRK